MTVVRSPHVAGTYYPDDPELLSTTVRGLLAEPLADLVGDDRRAPKAIIAPHSPYVYSGSTAALAYARLSSAADTVSRVILLGPGHGEPLRGLALPGVSAFATPLGEVPVDAESVAALTAADLPQVATVPEAHVEEHSLEVHLPFLQVVLGSFTVVPLVVGQATPSEVADVLDVLWGGPETVIVVSSDLSHHLRYEDARAVDEVTIGQVLDGRGALTPEQACGANPVNGIALAAHRRELSPELLGSCSSGDAGAERSRVVGFASFIFPAEAA